MYNKLQRSFYKKSEIRNAQCIHFSVAIDCVSKLRNTYGEFEIMYFLPTIAYLVLVLDHVWNLFIGVAVYRLHIYLYIDTYLNYTCLLSLLTSST